jgi:hypothetical protein
MKTLHETIDLFSREKSFSGILVYGLVDPETGDIRYVGQTRHPLDRFRAHLLRKSCKNNPGLKNWLSTMQAQGLEIRVDLLSRVFSSAEVDKIEREWIADLRQATSPGVLLNIADGGSGVPEQGRVFSKLHCERLSASLKGKKRTPSVIEANRDRCVKRWATSEYRDCMAYYNFCRTGKPQSQSTKDKRAASHRGKKRTELARKHLREAHRRPDVVEKCRQAAIRGWEARRKS